VNSRLLINLKKKHSKKIKIFLIKLVK